MAYSLIISDLHLCAEQPRSMQVFLHFIQQIALGADTLFILGDLFEYWAGDDDIDDPFNRQITHALHALSVSGTAISMMHGNRDLLMGQKLAQASGATLLNDPTLLDLYGTPTLLTHGDLLCTDDIAYQDFRKQVHEPIWQQNFLDQPLAQRKAAIAQLRARSEKAKKHKNENIMDVNLDAVASMLRQHHYPRMIHGHTHRLKRHLHTVDGHNCERWVLGDWHETGNALRCDVVGCSWETITL
ncbi:UDP-2,3-diacylglucosamine diphosphatase [Candidatus Nitrotoga arctica]|uniref:UDP-2,3-diacylglucosamine hydrolase n=1 Tax=Candidatus Nitrotoga arctica TaxID=453162 RepID=A0ABN8AFD3_9PROT|nr:UDP-2,3-diacylglucosamine diphosphatase [Candidatus Nitrotoga arctica]CAG9931460.1 UDP-2,3-diacylglucosamine diphosphatase [Candidatus Nitrotoga arctica]